MKQQTVKVVTLGCSKNTVDSEVLMRQLRESGFAVSTDNEEENSEIIIINTCGFINDAKEESINTILHYADLKNRGLVKQLFVTGCLAERYMDDLRNEIPEVDYFSGVSSTGKILNRLGSRVNNDIMPDRLLTGPGHYAYLKISEGCNRHCAFCSIPYIRGKHISRTPEDILKETILLAEKGVRELILIAQDLNFYGIDLKRKRMLPFLLEEILKQNKFEWIRLQYLYPSGLTEALLDIIKNNIQICKYIDIPIQHITDRMLNIMKRGYSRYSLEKLLWGIREKIPGAAIRTTLIAGHPGETKKDFEDLKKFVSGFRFDRLGVFRYSHEEGTYSYRSYRNSVPESEKAARVSELMEIQQTISLEINQKKIDKSFRVLIDGREGEYFTGRTEADSPEVDQEVLIKKSYKLTPGNFYNIRITDAAEFDLFGVPDRY